MNYQETIQWMFSCLPMYQRQGSSAFKKDLGNSLALSEHLGTPERSYPIVHVAGTNGKGSTSHMIASVLQSAGYSTGLYTSPHLKDFRERIKVDGKMISEPEVVGFVEENKGFLERQKLSFFEMTVGMAFEHFRNKKVDIAIVEVGLGGRLDSTNIVHPIVSVITNIGYDHMQFLGETLPEIAGEKAGIIKQGVPVVIGETQREVEQVFKSLAKQNEAPIFFADSGEKAEFGTDLLGDYQMKNMQTAVAALKLIGQAGFQLDENAYRKGLENVIPNTKLLGRYQKLSDSPRVICDTAHNREGLSLVLSQLAKEPYDQLHIVLGMVSDKDLNTVLPLFPKRASYYFCKPDIPRGMDAQLLRERAGELELAGKVYSSVIEAYRAALKAAGSEDLIYVGGSTFVVAELPLED